MVRWGINICHREGVLGHVRREGSREAIGVGD
jgi:hypothetical protein